MLKMFANYIIKTPTCFGHKCLTIFRGPFSILSVVTTSNNTKHRKQPPEDGQTIVAETCRGFNDVICKHF